MRQYLTPLLTLVVQIVLSAQSTQFLSGSLTIAEGTSLRFQGPGELVIQPGAAIINHGVIDLGDATILMEPVGAPITGGGSETATLNGSGPWNSVEPGGLGLTLSAGELEGPLTVTRGHGPRSFPEGDQSVARWFAIDAPNDPVSEVIISMRYDPTELNGLSPENLGLFRSETVDGPWAAITSTNNGGASTVSGTLATATNHLTAFDANAPTASPYLFATGDLRVWPTLACCEVMVQAQNGLVLNDLEIFDAVGRLQRTSTTASSDQLAVIDVSGLARGIHHLRVNRQVTIKVIKE